MDKRKLEEEENDCNESKKIKSLKFRKFDSDFKPRLITIHCRREYIWIIKRKFGSNLFTSSIKGSRIGHASV